MTTGRESGECQKSPERASFVRVHPAPTLVGAKESWGAGCTGSNILAGPVQEISEMEQAISDHARHGLNPAHPGLPELLITFFGHTFYLPQGDTMFLGQPKISRDFS